MRHMHPHLRRVFTRSSKLADAAACRRRTHRARLISMAVVTAVLAVSAAVVAFLDWRDNGRYNVTVWGVPVFSWLLVGAMTLPLMVAAELLVFGLVFVLDAALSSAFENVQYVLLGMRTGLWYALARTVCNCVSARASGMCAMQARSATHLQSGASNPKQPRNAQARFA